MQSRVLACEHSATTCAPQRVIVTDLMILWCMHTVFYLQYCLPERSVAVSAEMSDMASAATLPS